MNRPTLRLTLATVFVLSLALPLLASTGIAPAFAQKGPAHLSVSPGTAIPGVVLHVSGSGFHGVGPVDVIARFRLLNGTTGAVMATAQTGSDGTFSNLPLRVPVAAAGNQGAPILAVGRNGHVPGQTSVHISNLAPNLSVTPNRTHAGRRITISGHGWAAGDAVTVHVASVAEATRTTNAAGGFHWTVTLPGNMAPATVPISATDEAGRQASTTLTVVAGIPAVSPTIAVSPQSANPGATVEVRGAHFSPGAIVTVVAYFRLNNGDIRQETVQTQVNGAGSFGPVPIQIPGSARGNHRDTIDALAGGRTAASTMVTVRAVAPTPHPHPAIAVTPTVGQAGEQVAVRGSGFRGNRGVSISFGNEQVATASTDRSGRFSAIFTVPSGMGSGQLTVTAREADGLAASTSFRLVIPAPQYRPNIQASPSPVASGKTVYVQGSGFPPDTGVTVTGFFRLTNGDVELVRASTATGSDGAFPGIGLGVPSSAATTVDAIAATAGTYSATTRIMVQRGTVTHHRRRFRFQYISLWYHVVSAGSWDHIVVQGLPHQRLGIWMHVVFPSGRRLYYYRQTNANGYWSLTFPIPRNALGRYLNRAYLVLRLWHGNRSRIKHRTFTVVP